MPTYNRTRMIGEAIEGVLRQTFKDFELLVIDDGSSDNTRQVVTAYRDRRVVYMPKIHGGPASARNYGLLKSRGRYIAYCDDDCLFFPQHLERLVTFLDKHPYIGLAYTDGFIYAFNKKLCKISFDFNHRRLETSSFFMLFNVMHRKTCIDKVGYFNEKLFARSDWDMWLRISDIFAVTHISETTGKHVYIDNVPSMTGAKQKGLYTEHIYESRIRKAKKWGEIIDYIISCSIGVTKNLIAYGNTSYAQQLSNEFYRTIKNYSTITCRGLCFFGKGKFAQALTWFRKAEKGLPKNWRTTDPWIVENVLVMKVYLARTYYHLGMLRCSQKICEEILNIMPDNIEARIQLLRIWTAQRRFKEVLQTCRLSVLRGQIYNPEINNVRGYCYGIQHKFSRALHEFKTAILIDPNVPLYHYNLGITYMQRGDYYSARPEFEKALLLNLKNIQIKGIIKQCIKRINPPSAPSLKARVLL